MIIWWVASDTGWNAECKAFSSGKPIRPRVKFLYKPLFNNLYDYQGCVAPPKETTTHLITYKLLEWVFAYPQLSLQGSRQPTFLRGRESFG